MSGTDTTIGVPSDLKGDLDDEKLYDNEPYYAVIMRLLENQE